MQNWPPLRRRGRPGPGASRPRQGQGRGRRAAGRALDPGPPCVTAPSSHWPSSMRAIATNCSNGSTIAPSRSCPARAVSPFEQIDQPALQPVAGHALCVRHLEEGPRTHRLPRRGRRPLLLGALRPGQAAARCPPHRPTPSSSSTRASGSPATSAHTARAVTPR